MENSLSNFSSKRIKTSLIVQTKILWNLQQSNYLWSEWGGECELVNSNEATRSSKTTTPLVSFR